MFRRKWDICLLIVTFFFVLCLIHHFTHNGHNALMQEVLVPEWHQSAVLRMAMVTSPEMSTKSYLFSKNFNRSDHIGHLKASVLTSTNSTFVSSRKKRNSTKSIPERRRLQQNIMKMIDAKVRFNQDVSMNKYFAKGGVVEVRRKSTNLGLPTTVNPDHWEGLNSSEIHSHFPGLVLSPDYILGRHFVASDDPSAAGMQGQPHNIEDMTDGQAEERFYQLITMLHMDCMTIQRMGSLDDGGWDLCTVEPYSFKPGCIAYSFGINYDFTFDDAVANAFDCKVASFDPSMTISDYLRSTNVHFYRIGIGPENVVTDRGWQLLTLKTIMTKLHHTKKVIDVLKMDIEYNEWACLQQVVSDGSLDNVKQLIFEMHTPEVETVQRPSSKQDFLDMYSALLSIELIGFRRYHYHYNPFGHYTSIRTGKTRSCCFELYYLNIQFLKDY